MKVVGLPIAVRQVRRWTDTAALLLLGSAVLVLVGLGALLASGHRVLIVRSGSMAPAIGTGDVAVTTVIGPSDVEIGDVVTFRDPSRSGDLVTHRVVKARSTLGRFRFLTKGDANTGTEQWSIDADGKLGRLWFTIPKAGYALAWAGDPRMRAGLLTAGAVILGFAAIRRIWTG
jgi:signal peptidase